jgi:hypothetical protein
LFFLKGHRYRLSSPIIESGDLDILISCLCKRTYNKMSFCILRYYWVLSAGFSVLEIDTGKMLCKQSTPRLKLEELHLHTLPAPLYYVGARFIYCKI